MSILGCVFDTENTFLLSICLQAEQHEKSMHIFTLVANAKEFSKVVCIIYLSLKCFSV